MSDETMLEALNKIAVEQDAERAKRERPWRLHWAAKARHLSHLSGIVATYRTREAAEAGLKRKDAEQQDDLYLPMHYWITHRDRPTLWRRNDDEADLPIPLG